MVYGVCREYIYTLAKGSAILATTFAIQVNNPSNS